jgi:hypothetical protein
LEICSCGNKIDNGSGQIYDGQLHCDACGNLKATEIVNKLKNFGNGAHSHSANKCAFYIEKTINASEKQRIRNLAYRIIQDELIELASNAMATNDWSKLREHMKKWW